MKRLVIIGAGTAGTIVANRMCKALGDDWEICVVEPAAQHLYQPDLLFLPFGAASAARARRRRVKTLDPRVHWRQYGVTAIEPDRRRVRLETGNALPYDLLVIASGTRIRPELTENLHGRRWHACIHDFYTLQGAVALRDALRSFTGGRLVVNVVEMPIKCPVAPLEFLFLADAFFTANGTRKNVELVYATPLDAAFTKPLAARKLGYLLEEKGIQVEAEFATASVAERDDVLISYDERRIAFDLLVSIPTHSGAEYIERSGLGNELAFVPTDPHTLLAKGYDDIFVLGDATDLPSSKAGSVGHYQSEIVEHNLLKVIQGQPPDALFDGHSTCFVETGARKAMLIDFNYETEPLPGNYPLPRVGPFTLLGESRTNHLGKLAFRWTYWNMLLPGRPLGIRPQMSMAGKHAPAKPAQAL